MKNLERIYFAGSEPLIMPEHWDFIDELIDTEILMLIYSIKLI